MPEWLIVGLADFDDAAVVKLSDDIALVSTLDFFPPLVDDPGDYGAIAAANVCSDIFAMGGDVVVALNVAAFPESLPTEVIAEILAAAALVVREAGGVIAGGQPSAHRNRSSGWRFKESSDPESSSPRVAHSQATSWPCQSHLAADWPWPLATSRRCSVRRPGCGR